MKLVLLALVCALFVVPVATAARTSAATDARAAAAAARAAAKVAKAEAKTDARAIRTAAHSPSAPSTPTASTSGVSLSGGTLSGTGLEPGHVYYATFVFTPAPGFETVNGATCGLILNAGGPVVKADGTITFQNDKADVDPCHVPGVLRAWLHDGIAPLPVAVGPDGPLETTATIGT